MRFHFKCYFGKFFEIRFAVKYSFPDRGLPGLFYLFILYSNQLLGLGKDFRMLSRSLNIIHYNKVTVTRLNLNYIFSSFCI